MISVKIYKPAKTAMSSGRGNARNWILQYEREKSQYIEPVMQWTASTSTRQEVKLLFPTKEEAIAFADKNGWKYTLFEPHAKYVKPSNYTDNFMPCSLK